MPSRIETAGSDDPDLPLALALQSGDDEALAELMRRHREPLFRFIQRYVLDHTTAADLVQETFVRAYFHVAQFRPQARFATWLYRIALNLCRDHSRSAGARQARLTTTFSATDDATTERTPRDEASTHEALRQLEISIERLPHDLKAPLILTALEGVAQERCAELLGITRKAVETRVYRARKLLEKSLSKSRPP
jgi:RNA polymerase sigma factor (sigma-70 family)